MKRQSLAQREKYNVTQKIIQTLADLESRTILLSIVKKARFAQDIAGKCEIPLSTVYTKLRIFEELTLVNVERIETTYTGKKIKFYKSRIREANIQIKKSETSIVLTPN